MVGDPVVGDHLVVLQVFNLLDPYMAHIHALSYTHIQTLSLITPWLRIDRLPMLH